MGIYKFGNNTYPQCIRRRSNLGHNIREKKCVLWARKYGTYSFYYPLYWILCSPHADHVVLKLPTTHKSLNRSILEDCSLSLLCNEIVCTFGRNVRCSFFLLLLLQILF